MDALPFALPQRLVVDPTASNTLYMATGDLGIFKTVDGGATWTKANSGIAGTNIQQLAINPIHPRTLYAAPDTGVTPGTVYKTVDGGSNWTVVDSAPRGVAQLAVDGQNPNIVYEVGGGVTRKSLDGGATWSTLAFPGTSIQSLVLDPRVSGNIVAISNPFFCGPFCGNTPPYLYRSVDGGADWTQLSSPYPTPPLTFDGSTNPSTLYDGLIYRSVDGGVTWSSIGPSPVSGSNTSAVAVDPSGTLYGAVYASGVFISRDHAQTWTATGSLAPASTPPALGTSIVSLVPAGSNGTLYAIVNQAGTSGFVTRLSPDGSSIVYSTYLRGHASLEAYVLYAAEPGVFQTQNWISSIALDAAGNVVVAGGTRSTDFPLVIPAQATNAGLADAFVSTIPADGSKVTYSTYFGGSQDDGALAVAVDGQGNVILAGQTWSLDFPVPGGVQAPAGLGKAFVVKLPPPAAPVITSVVNGASFQPGIEAGSWVTIRGTNLASTNPGRTWRSDEVVNGNLPTSLDGVSVTIDARPAFVYYISPAQLNVQAPSDAAVGAVSVVVTNNGAASAPATAQLQPFAPAFFQYPGTSYAIASRLPDYAAVADPAAVPGAVAAKPGDLVVLWGTGFGATNPPTPAGVVVSGAPAAATAPTVTVGGAAAQVLDTVLTAGSAGLYQLTIQIPEAAPAGAAALQASVGGVRTVDGVTIFVGQ